MINDNDDDPPPGSFSRTHPTSDAPRNVRHPLSSFNSKCPNIPRPTGGGCGIREFEIRTLRPSQSARTLTKSPVRDHLARGGETKSFRTHRVHSFISPARVETTDERESVERKTTSRFIFVRCIARGATEERENHPISNSRT